MQQCFCELPFPGDQCPLCLVKKGSPFPEEPLWGELSASPGWGPWVLGPRWRRWSRPSRWGSRAPHRCLHMLCRTQLRGQPPQSRHSGSACSLPAGPPSAGTALTGALGGPGSGTEIIRGMLCGGADSTSVPPEPSFLLPWPVACGPAAFQPAVGCPGKRTGVCAGRGLGKDGASLRLAGRALLLGLAVKTEQSSLIPSLALCLPCGLAAD